MSHINTMKKLFGLEVAKPVFGTYANKKKLAVALGTQLVTSGKAKMTEDPTCVYLRFAPDGANEQWTFKLDKKSGDVKFSAGD